MNVTHSILVNPAILSAREVFHLNCMSQVNSGQVAKMRYSHIFVVPPPPPPKKPERNLIVISQICAHYFMITSKEIAGKSREGDVMHARRIFCTLARELTNLSLAKIGAFINRDHATVINASKYVYRSEKDVFKKPIYDHYVQIKKLFK